MNRRTFLQVAGTTSVVGFSGCSAVGKDDENSRTRRHRKSSSVWNGVPTTIRQTVFIPDVVVKDGQVDVLTSIGMDLPTESPYKPTEATVSLVVDAIADEWTRQWESRELLSGTLSAQLQGGDTISITSETTFESGGSVQTTRYEEVR